MIYIFCISTQVIITFTKQTHTTRLFLWITISKKLRYNCSQCIWHYSSSLLICTVVLTGGTRSYPPVVGIPAICDKYILWITKTTPVCLYIQNMHTITGYGSRLYTVYRDCHGFCIPPIHLKNHFLL